MATLTYTLEALKDSINLIFNLSTSKTIYRKTSFETTWTEVTTTSSRIYKDEVARSPKVIYYKVSDIEKSILFSNVIVYEK